MKILTIVDAYTDLSYLILPSEKICNWGGRTMRIYKGIDVGRLLFACLIPFFHIGFTQSTGINLVRQYIARLGVPFYFATAGMFLIQSVEKHGNKEALTRYTKRVGRMLLLWIVIYSPFIVKPTLDAIQVLLFKTPAYLWFLTALLVASVPFCLVRNRKLLWTTGIILYVAGTLLGDSYGWLTGGCFWYNKIFLTTRNGVFFGLPLMCVGELTWKKEKKSIPMLIIAALLLFAEITFVGLNTTPWADRSMYILLPLFTYYLVLTFRDWSPDIDTRYFGGISSAIYVMQFGVIAVVNKVFAMAHINETWMHWVVWLMVICIPTAVYFCMRKTKIVKLLF